MRKSNTDAGAKKDVMQPTAAAHAASNPVDELHREMGARLSAGVMGMLDFLSGLRNDGSRVDPEGIASIVRTALAQEHQALRQELRELRSAVDEVKTALHKLSVLSAASLQGGAEHAAAPPVQAPVAKPELLSERIRREHVIERMLTTTRRLQEAGRDINQMTAASLAREAGVKPAQFTYAFKNRENFMLQYNKWLAEQQSA